MCSYIVCKSSCGFCVAEKRYVIRLYKIYLAQCVYESTGKSRAETIVFYAQIRTYYVLVFVPVDC